VLRRSLDELQLEIWPGFWPGFDPSTVFWQSTKSRFPMFAGSIPTRLTGLRSHS
jgi:hypothetical protein